MLLQDNIRAKGKYSDNIRVTRQHSQIDNVRPTRKHSDMKKHRIQELRCASY